MSMATSYLIQNQRRFNCEVVTGPRLAYDEGGAVLGAVFEALSTLLDNKEQYARSIVEEGKKAGGGWAHQLSFDRHDQCQKPASVMAYCLGRRELFVDRARAESHGRRRHTCRRRRCE